MGYFGVRGTRERCCRLGWLRRWEPGAKEEERERFTGDCETMRSRLAGGKYERY